VESVAHNPLYALGASGDTVPLFVRRVDAAVRALPYFASPAAAAF
jgi:hypothetical protein